MGNKEQTFHKIIEIAYGMFAENGFEKTSLAMIATEVGISKPAIYYYFQSKDQLIAFIFDELYKEIQHDVAVDYKELSSANFKEELLKLGYKSIEAQDKDPYFNKIFNQYVLLAARDENYKRQLVELETSFLTSFVAILRYGVQLGVLEDTPHIEVKAQMLALVYDNIGNFMLTGNQLNYRAIWKEAVNSVIQGGKDDNKK
ncbi:MULTISPECIES: TetR/AcrR family transcriptional regulator [Lysinibacillus]|uniref:TetR/AcrR family transcriptional regulator n=1 Tax=Lysinibacillus TaxID=400634 RepID=UPI0021A48B7B|nr:TetR/AcrR family transcriptional regulator [Lysinibacillus capsici]MCT1538868.1 TetR/AcrR family transcriptional regulator [Lysinibacillus capsici]MCT1569915.1 TetR/AcrR family transcriptional regulator [Lysinibacillus capsici]MCT1647373.1 TetR/AcrR family transcriptional regulator [Lysinibacillus capsici]MCT1725914.1 TetR/AcrR family transcriptional regulator [Lysinibacillus capsici]MCT1782679.1 TetR/AcrR family transcriptional regulator [Lysinibacillus capsici]